MSTTLKAAPGIAEQKEITVRGIRFMLIETESRWPGRGDIFAFRLRADGKFHEEFCGFRSFNDVEEFCHESDEVADWAGFNSSEAPKDRVIEALGAVTWDETTGCLDEDGNESGPCGGQYPFSGKIRWLVLEGWAGWTYADSGLGVASNIADRVRVTRWKEIAA